MTTNELFLTPAITEAGSKPKGARGPLLHRLLLKPYGDTLLTPGAAFWIFSARIAIFIMAAAEAVSWSYLGYYIGQSSQPYLTAALTGLAIFTVIWIVDASFITLDTARSKDEALLGRETNPRLEKVKLAAGLVVRVAIISATLFISAPFLAQLVFYRDISNEMQRRDSLAISAKRAEISATFDARVAQLQQLRQNLEAASIAEAAGTGGSRRMGRGPAVATIERRLAEIDANVAAVRAEQSKALAGFDALPRAEMPKRYGVQLAEDGIRARGEILESLTQNATYANAELAIRGFLAFLFLALIILKLFQPASVSIYFSETMQDLHALYRNGAFDAWLTPAERRDMPPLRFREWCTKTYRVIRDEDERQQRVSRAMAAARVREDELTRVRRSAETELSPIRGEHQEALGTLASLRDRTASVARELVAQQERVATQSRDLDGLIAMMNGGLTGEAFVRAVEARTALSSSLAASRGQVRETENVAAKLASEIDAQQSRVDELASRLAARESVVRTVDEQLARVTQELASVLGA